LGQDLRRAGYVKGIADFDVMKMSEVVVRSGDPLPASEPQDALDLVVDPSFHRLAEDAEALRLEVAFQKPVIVQTEEIEFQPTLRAPRKGVLVKNPPKLKTKILIVELDLVSTKIALRLLGLRCTGSV